MGPGFNIFNLTLNFTLRTLVFTSPLYSNGNVIRQLTNVIMNRSFWVFIEINLRRTAWRVSFDFYLTSVKIDAIVNYRQIYFLFSYIFKNVKNGITDASVVVNLYISDTNSFLKLSSC